MSSGLAALNVVARHISGLRGGTNPLSPKGKAAQDSQQRFKRPDKEKAPQLGAFSMRLLWVRH
jgi:hypothetical protein